MKNRGLFSKEFFVNATGLIVSIVVVGAFYSGYVRPKAENIEITTELQASQNPDEPMVADRSFVMIIKDREQQACFTLMLWGCIIIAYKMLTLRGEQAMLGRKFVNITRGERIIPEEALSHYKDVETRVKRDPKAQGKILPDVVMSALHRFDATRSIQDAAQAVKERAEMAYEQLESDLSLVRYIAWAIPSVGFIGTVRGIGEALSQADQAIQGDISGVTAALGLAFNSTLIALMLSIILMFLVHLLQSRQESLLIEIEDLVTKKVVCMMKTPAHDETSVSFT